MGDELLAGWKRGAHENIMFDSPLKNILRMSVSMSRKNRQLVTNEPVEFET